MGKCLDIVREITLHYKSPFLWRERLIVLQYSYPLVNGLPSDVLTERLCHGVGTIGGGWNDDTGALLIDEVRPHHIENSPNLKR